MAGIHIFSTQSDISDSHTYRVEVLDATLSTGNGLELPAGGSPLVKYSASESLHPWLKVVPSKAECFFLVENASRLTKITDLVGAPDGRFFLVIKQDDQVIWRGALLTADITLPRAPFPYIVQLSASDGLARLRKVEKEHTTQANIIAQLVMLLGETLVPSIMESTDTLLTTVNRYYSVGMVNRYEQATDPLRYIRINDSKALYIESDTDEVKYSPYFDGLEDICTAFGLRIFMQMGHFYAIQVDAYNEYLSNSLPMTEHSYTKNIAFDSDAAVAAGSASAQTFTPEVPILPVEELPGGQEQFAPIVRFSKITFKNNSNGVAVPKTLFNDFQTNGNPWVFGLNVTFEEKIELKFTNSILDVSNTNTSFSGILEINYLFYVKVGAEYYTNDMGPDRWTTNRLPYRHTRSIAAPLLPQGILNAWDQSGNPLFIATLAPPSSTGSFSVELDIEFRDRAGSLVSGYTANRLYTEFKVTRFNNIIAAIQGNSAANFASQEKITIKYGLNEDAGYILDFEKSRLLDAPNFSFNGKLQNYDGSAWKDTQLWRRFDGSGTGAQLLYLQVEAAYRMQQQSLRVLNTTILRSDYLPYNLLQIDGRFYIPISLTYNYGRNEVAGSWIEIGTYDTSTATPGDVTIGITPGLGGDPPSGGGSGGSGNGVVGPLDPGLQGLGKISFLDDGLAAGAITEMVVSQSEEDVANNGDTVQIVDLTTGHTDTVTLTADWQATDTVIYVSGTLNHNYDSGTFVTVPLKSLASRVYALENPAPPP